jgi:P-type Cu+ transporter
VIAGVVAAVVLAIGLLGFRLGAGGDAADATTAALAVLVAGCPLAAAVAGAAIRRIGGRRADALGLDVEPAELAVLAHADTVLVPRTGVLTAGAPELRTVTADDPDEVLRLAAAVEVPSEHVLARAIVAAADRELPDVAEFDGLPGQGVRGVVGELVGDRVLAHAVLVGSPALLHEHGIELPPELGAARVAAEAAGRVAVAVAWDGVARGVLDLDDPLRPGTAAAVAGLRRLGVRPVLVTGAGPVVATVLAVELGMTPDAGGAEPLTDPVVGTPDGCRCPVPVGADGLVTVLDTIRLARRIRRTGAAVQATIAAAAGTGAVAATTGTLGLLTAPAVPVAGLLAVASGALAVRLFRRTPAVPDPATGVATGNELRSAVAR